VVIAGCRLTAEPALLFDPETKQQLELSGSINDGVLSILIDGKEVISEEIDITGNKPFSMASGFFGSQLVFASCHLSSIIEKTIWCEVSIYSGEATNLVFR
jgi:hypothetical protein